MSPDQLQLVHSQFQLDSMLSSPVPRAAIDQLLSFFRNEIEKIEDIHGLSNQFYIENIEQHSRQDMQCLCGKRVKQLFKIAHVKYQISFGLGSECMKHFFPNARIAQIKKSHMAYVDFCKDLEGAIESGASCDDLFTQKALAFKLLDSKQIERLNYGLPLTLNERASLAPQIMFHEQKTREAKKNIAHRLLKPYKEHSKPSDFQFIMGLLEDGYVITNLNDLKQLDMTALALRVSKHFEKASSPNEPKVERNQNPIDETHNLHAIKLAISSIDDKKQLLTPKAASEFEKIMDQCRLLDGDDQGMHAFLTSRYIRQALVNMGNQLGLVFNLLK